MMTASKCISKLGLSRPSKCISILARSRSPNASPNFLNHGLQVHLQTRSITASNCISKVAWSQPPSVSLTSHYYVLQTRSITATNCISKVAWCRPPSVSSNSLDYILQTRSIIASDTSLSLLNHGVVKRWCSHNIRLEFVRNRGSSLRSVGRGWDDMKGLPAMIYHTNCMDLWMFHKNAWIFERLAGVHETKSRER